MHPPGAEVPVALGGSLQLTCRLLCADGATASVRWRGLDTSLGAMQPGSNLSVLYVRNASLAAAGTRVCTGSCGRKSYQRSVKLLVFGAYPHLPRFFFYYFASVTSFTQPSWTAPSPTPPTPLLSKSF